MFKGDEGDMFEVSVQMGHVWGRHAWGECLREDMSQESVWAGHIVGKYLRMMCLSRVSEGTIYGRSVWDECLNGICLRTVSEAECLRDRMRLMSEGFRYEESEGAYLGKYLRGAYLRRICERDVWGEFLRGSYLRRESEGNLSESFWGLYVWWGIYQRVYLWRLSQWVCQRKVSKGDVSEEMIFWGFIYQEYIWEDIKMKLASSDHEM